MWSRHVYSYALISASLTFCILTNRFLPDPPPKSQTYLGFISEDGRRIASSIFTGQLTVL
jgi:hypothetical protein